MKTPQLEDGYTRIANEIIEALASYRIPGEQMQCLFVILRKTYGYGKLEDNISISQFHELTGLHKPSICRALKGLEEKNIISKNANRKTTSYRFNKNYKKWKVLAKTLTVSNIANGVSKSANKSLAKVRHTKDNKDNIQKKDKGNGFKLPEWIPQDSWNCYMEVRGKIKCANTSKAKQLLVNKLQGFKNQGYSVREILEEATEKSWKSVYLPKDLKQNTEYPEINEKIEKWRRDNA